MLQIVKENVSERVETVMPLIDDQKFHEVKYWGKSSPKLLDS